MATDYIERDCVVTAPDGTPFESGGAIVNDDYIEAYVINSAGYLRVGQRVSIQDWHGEQLGTAWVTGRWRINSFLGTHMHSFRVTLPDGREYNARGLGAGMSITGKRARGI